MYIRMPHYTEYKRLNKFPSKPQLFYFDVLLEQDANNRKTLVLTIVF